MYARVARWEDVDPDKMRSAAQEINSRAESGPPEGVPSKGIMMLLDPDSGTALAVGLFETEDDYRTGDETLNSMDPPGGTFGRRASVTKYEVAVDLRADG
jgi:hypothetical protein